MYIKIILFLLFVIYKQFEMQGKIIILSFIYYENGYLIVCNSIIYDVK